MGDAMEEDYDRLVYPSDSEVDLSDEDVEMVDDFSDVRQSSPPLNPESSSGEAGCPTTSAVSVMKAEAPSVRRYIQKDHTTRHASSTMSSSHTSGDIRRKGERRVASARPATGNLSPEHYTQYIDQLPRFKLSYSPAKRSYSGEFDHFAVNDNAIRIYTSDGSEKQRPKSGRKAHKTRAADGSVRFGSFTEVEPDDRSYQHWCGEIGAHIAAAFLGKKQGSGLPWTLEDFPASYQLYRKTVPRAPKKAKRRKEAGIYDPFYQNAEALDREDNIRQDIYLYGSDVRYFSSPAEFVLHAIWLMLGARPGECYCKYCYTKPDGHESLQSTITEALTSAGASAVPPPHSIHPAPGLLPSTTLASSVNRTSSSRGAVESPAISLQPRARQPVATRPTAAQSTQAPQGSTDLRLSKLPKDVPEASSHHPQGARTDVKRMKDVQSSSNLPPSSSGSRARLPLTIDHSSLAPTAKRPENLVSQPPGARASTKTVPEGREKSHQSQRRQVSKFAQALPFHPKQPQSSNSQARPATSNPPRTAQAESFQIPDPRGSQFVASSSLNPPPVPSLQPSRSRPTPVYASVGRNNARLPLFRASSRPPTTQSGAPSASRPQASL